MIEFVIPVKTINEANGSHGHWRVKASRRKQQRKAAYAIAYWLVPTANLSHVVTMSRMSAGTLDDDNLRVSLKAIRDGIADAFGLPDNDPRIEWRYGQEKCKRGAYGVRVRIEALRAVGVPDGNYAETLAEVAKHVKQDAGFSAKRCAAALDRSSEND